MTEPPIDPSNDLPRESARTILFQFVVFPLGVVAVGVGIFLLFGMLASERHDVDDYVDAMRSGSSHRRWQAAYQLSKSLKRGEAARYPNLQHDVAAIYVESKDEPEVRRYLSMVLGKIGDRRSTPLLVDALKDRDAETRIYALWALAELQDPAALPSITAMTGDKDRDVRKTAVFALGRMASHASIPALVERLDDEAVDVQWNAAIALARLGDRRAVPKLRSMLHRRELDAMSGVREDQKMSAMIAAISAYSELVGAEARPELDAIASGDPNLRVRSAAKEAIERIK